MFKFFLFLSLLASTVLCATKREADIHVENKFNSDISIKVMHQYTGWNVDHSVWITLEPNEKKKILRVAYNTGFLTTGVDNWIVNVELDIGASAQLGNIPLLGEIKAKGAAKIPLKSGHGLFSKWKVHTLREEDENKETTIRVSPSLVEFLSPSGSSSTSLAIVGTPSLLDL
jgi:hypothetical protein